MGQINKYASTRCPLFGKTTPLGLAPIERFDMFAPIYVGEDDTGHDVKFFGATTGCFAIWDESEDLFQVQATFTADAQIGTYDRRIRARTTYNTAVTTGKFAHGMAIDIRGTGDVDSGGFLYGLWINVQGTGTMSGNFYMLSMSVQGTGLNPRGVIQFRPGSSSAVVYLLQIDKLFPPIYPSSTGTHSGTYKKILCDFNDTDYYLIASTMT